ncbi:MAG: hypothetical protein Q8S11_06365 [Daejeonella sp.]|uniref:hypothetical protein n=1 Tax=Daejeonella sp. TaxID=2805397 RepID=UPI002732FB66|nr:hypothetical protein [Daejeonella sp.]MDP3467939.1 hypothetical protein [Daejeonella sp.]
MKKVFILFLFYFMVLTHSMVYAQSPGLSIKLLDALSFTISQPQDFDLEYINTGKMKNRIVAKVPDHITVISSRGYEVRAVSGASNDRESQVSLTSHISKTNKGNTSGLVFGRGVQLEALNGSAVTVISSSNTSWNGINPENKFDIDYSLESTYSPAKGGVPPTIPVIFTVLQP